MQSPPSFAQLDNSKVFCVYRGSNDQVMWSTFDGHQWTQPLQIPNALSITSPTVASYQGSLVCLYHDNVSGPNGGGAIHGSTYTPTAGWSPDAVINVPGGGTLDGINGSPTLVVYNGLLYCFYQFYNGGGNLRCASFDGTSWTQVGGKNTNLPSQVPGMSASPTAAVFGNPPVIYCLYQNYKNQGGLTGCTFDGTTWSGLGNVLPGQMSASPAAVVWRGALLAFYQGYANSGSLRASQTTEGFSWTPLQAAPINMVPGTSPSAAQWVIGNDTRLVTATMVTTITRPTYPPTTTISDSDAQQLLTKFRPVVYLSSQEEYFPATVDWYLPLVEMTFKKGSLGAVTAQEISTLVTDGVPSYLLPVSGTGSYTAANDYRLRIVNGAAQYGITPYPPAAPQAPIYGAVLDNTAMVSTDLVYMFFYGYNGLAGNDVGIAYHEGDWEHIIVRLRPDHAGIVGIYYQAHGTSFTYSGWYYPPGTAGRQTYSCFGSGANTPIVYSAAESHASYTAPGTYPLGGFMGLKGSDTADAGRLWTPQVLLVAINETPWIQYAGKWGARAGVAADPPDAPVIQGWFQPRTDGPYGDPR